MTIIQPDKNKRGLTYAFMCLGIVLAILISGNVFIYNTIVNLNHNINLAGERINKMEVANAELKNKMYNLIDPRALDLLAEKSGLVKDKGPQYFQVTINAPWVFASQP